MQKQLPLLNSLKEKALIFAGGSAMNALNSMEVFPHFGGGIDPNEMQLSRLETNRAVDVPYFYRNRMFYKAFRIIKGKRLYITGNGGYGVADWFEENPHLKIFNATEGGIGFPQIENIPFEHAVKTYLMHDFSLEERVQNQIKKSSIITKSVCRFYIM